MYAQNVQALLSELTCGCSNIQQSLFEQCTNSVFGELKSFGTTYYRHNQFWISQLPMIKHEIHKIIHVIFVCYTHILQKINNNNDDGENLYIYTCISKFCEFCGLALHIMAWSLVTRNPKPPLVGDQCNTLYAFPAQPF